MLEKRGGDRYKSGFHCFIMCRRRRLQRRPSPRSNPAGRRPRPRAHPAVCQPTRQSLPGRDLWAAAAGLVALLLQLVRLWVLRLRVLVEASPGQVAQVLLYALAPGALELALGLDGEIG